MKTRILLLAVLATSLFSCRDKGGSSNYELTTEADSLSYAFGVLISTDYTKFKMPPLNPDKIHEGASEFMDSSATMKVGDCLAYNSKLGQGISQGKMDISTMNAEELKQKSDSLSYAIGILLANDNVENKLPEIVPNALKQGVIDLADTSRTLLLDLDACKDIYEYHTNIARQRALAKQKEQELKQAEAFLPVKEAGEKYLEENLKKDGVVSTPSGLQYRIIKEGSGEKPVATSQVKVHYTGKTIEGKVFDSSVERGEPAIFGLNQVIRGWTEGLSMMPVGSKWELYIPYNLAYGTRQVNELIVPYSTLIFEVEMLEILQ